MAKDIINKQLNISKDSELNKKSKEQIMASTIDNKEYDKKEVGGINSEKEMHQINNECIKNKDIAIIGIACRFPGAENYGQFWENIKRGLSNIQEIPQNRWDWQALWGDPQIEINKSNSKWGGFIKNVDTFDASFFGFSPRESEVMDPQQRIMLELAWSCLEDGGVRPSDVSGKKVGVYLGVFSSDYKELQEREFRAIEMYHSIGTATAVVANRISHYFNFKGPSIPIDTACSSALSAIHAAINSLRSGECSMALVGGINLLLTPTRYISYSKTGMLSPTGSCKTFDESADGYVRGEGAGLILVKPLEQAIKDGDSIYGILKGSAINHNGKTHTLTYPNPEAQADVIIEACKQARVTPESISYIETHGTGTPKGDPLEFQGLLKAFESLSSQGKQSLKRNYCGLGAVKTNIGHLESAAGIAGVIKVLLSMKYKQLPGLQNFKRLNHRIAVENSPFYFIDRLQAWKPLKDVNNKAYPRRAGVSSFGFGGTNAHVILEEAPVIAKHSNIKVPYYLICLSAKTKEALRRKEEDLLYWLEEEGIKHKLIEISATLLMGREHFAIRSAFVVRDVQELQKRLKQVLEKGEAEGYYIEGNIKKGEQMSPLLVELGKTIVKELQANKLKDEQEYGQKLMALAELYTSGHNLDWQMILPKGKISRISLPTYPFARERYWISDSDEESYSKIISSGKLTSIHPLLHQNTSDLFEQRFSSSFTGEESFLADYVVKGQRILPRVAYLEMARAAIGKAAGSLEENQIGLRFKNVVWARPIAIGKQSMQVHIGIYPEENGEIAYEIYSEPQKDNAEPVIHSQGSVALCAVTESSTLDLHSLRVQCSQGIFSSSQCYEVFRTVGLDYGPGYQGIEQVYVGQEQVLAKLTLPATVSDTKDQFILHPSLMDAALQASLMISASDVKLALPFALQELKIFEKCTSTMWALIRYSEGSKAKDKMKKIDIDLCDEQGRVCVRMKGLSSRVLEGKVDSVTDTEAIGTLMLQPSWQEKIVDSEATMPEYDRHLVMLCESHDISQEDIENQINGVRCLTLHAEQEGIESRFNNYAVQAFEQIKNILKDKHMGKVLVQIIVINQGEQQLFAGLSGLLKTAQLENPKLIGQLIEMEPGKKIEEIIEKLKENSRSPIDNHIRYQENKRCVASWNKVDVSKEAVKIPWKDQGVYLITGGAGGLGLIFAKEIAHKVKDATLILTGRTSLKKDKQAKLKELEELGAKIVYKQVDMTQKEAVADLIESIRKDFKNLNGIIHSAGVIRDNFIIKKTKEEVQAVLAPKVTGLVNLDEASKELNLDFFVFFSSTTGALGNLGQADYATANAFMDVYARYRSNLVASKQRHGQTLSINWPLWQEGGMSVDEETEKTMRQNTGMIAMEKSIGIWAFYQGVALGKAQLMVLEGDLSQMQAYLLDISPKVHKYTEEASTLHVEQWQLREKTLYQLKVLFGEVTKVSVNKLDPEEPLESYGINSIMIIQLNQKLDGIFGELSKTLFYEYQTLNALAEYFTAEYPQKCLQWTGLGEQVQPIQDKSTISMSVGEFPVLTSLKKDKTLTRDFMELTPNNSVYEPIAIIGMSGRYPKAKTLKEYWDILKTGQDCISEIPQERWSMEGFYHSDFQEAVAQGKSYSKWGGFVEEFADFDPLFFNISPLEAISMDPQERLFIEACWAVLEDAGYTKEQLGEQYDRRVGVFAGITKTGFELYGPDLWKQGEQVYPSTSFGSVANRISYLLNLQGPSMPIDTMCSSSLTAIHEACEHLYRGECEMAIAGGVNLYLHPSSYIRLCNNHMLSVDGKCKSFGQGGNGFVPGEGVGTVLLKRLSQAIADGDHIYAVIRGTSINHGGKTNGYTVPNPIAQGDLIRTALDKAGIDARAVSYIEAHGTGTALGDPIEITGLSQAFQKDTQETGFCAIGSAKSNIGHLEAAAGIAGVTKIVLQMKNQEIVPSLHATELNPNINFGKTPFVVQRELAEWKRPVVEINGESKEYPRIAGISSFGAGGSNAHIVLEEYIPKNQERRLTAITPQDPAIIVLSAKNEERLQVQVQQLLSVIQEQKFGDSELIDMAYTLQVGREAMEERLAMIVGSVKELAEKLQGFVEGKDDIKDLYRGQVKRDKEDFIITMAMDEEMQETIQKWIQQKKYAKLLELWVKGFKFNWNELYADTKPHRVSLPTYPFARERYWLPEIYLAKPAGSLTTNSIMHPLLHQNTSDLSEQRFTSTFTGQEFFLADHIVKGQRILPGVAYLEMARVAVQQASAVFQEEKAQIKLQNIVWTRPITVGEKPVQVHIGLYPEETGQIAYEIYSQPDEASAESIVHSQGIAVLGTVLDTPTLDLSALQAECSKIAPAANQLYEAFKTMGIDYGPAHQGIEQLYIGQNQVLARITLPSSVANTKNQFVLHPSLMDAALQSSSCLITDKMPSDKTSLKPILPFALDELEIFGSCTSSMWVHIRPNVGSIAGDKLQKLDIDICNDQGNICVRMKAFTFRMLEGELDASGTAMPRGLLLLQPGWSEQTVADVDLATDYAQHLVILCEQDDISPESISARMNKVRCLALQSSQLEIEERFAMYAIQVFGEIQGILKDKAKGQVLIQLVVSRSSEQQFCSALWALLKTAQLENPKLIGQLIEMESGKKMEEIIGKLNENSRTPIDNHIRYQENKRYVASWNKVDVSKETVKIPWKDQGVYLITGGAGGLGLIFAKEIVHKVKDATLILTGRTPLDADKHAKFNKLEDLGARIIYKQVDVTQKEAVANLIQSIKKDFGNLNGIIHGAGVIRDNFFIKKTKEELQAVLAPKVNGVVNLDEASRKLSLDFFIIFSSIAGSIGNIGQADYAAANAFMDIYAKYRNDLVVSKQRQGQTLSINWPLWKEGGMHVDATTEKTLKQSTGMTAMQTASGIQALYQSLYSGKDQVMVIEGDLKRLQAVFLRQPDGIETVKLSLNIKKNKAIPSIGEDMLREKAEHYFKKLLSFVFKMPVNRIEATAPLEQYGIDSVMVIQLTNQLEKTFGSLSKTLFFEYQSIQELTGYFLEAYRDQLIELLGIEGKVAATNENFKDSITMAEPLEPTISTQKRSRFVSLRNQSPQEKSGDFDIAIIGVSGRYPGAKNIQEFWKNLQAGKDCITEIPNDRWDHSLYFDEDKNKPGKTYSKWGGFLDGVDQFDTLFFNISPREAEMMDPQERLFLECVYETLEDAGYTRESLGLCQDFGLDGNVGVFVGVMYEEYQLYGAQAQSKGRPISIPGNPAMIANRVSYFCNFHGPSMAVDTMCSSSLTAIHLACQSLQRSGCELAIAGGVNVSIHPNKYLVLGQGRFVSSKGRCESFGQGGDGYVPGEGVGAVLLKPLSKAITDGDHIYGIIKATALNHGGKTNGYTVPNPNAQASVIGRALKDARINPRMISYIEAHGTGTSLGDPIEIAGLMKTFQEYTKEKQFCAIGSAKSNIGHCESAAGIAGLTKILLQLKYRQLVPSLHSEVLNSNIDFTNSPFVVQQELAEWKRPMIEVNGITKECSRIAGISSFGAGGSNAHVVIEEYISQAFEKAQITTTSQNSAVIVLSAKSEAQLQEQAKRLLVAIKDQQFSEGSLADIAYTLQVGREAMDERLGLIVGSIKDLEEKLKSFIEAQDGVMDLYQGQVKRNREALAIFAADDEMTKIVEAWMNKRNYGKVLDLWVKGLTVDWNKLYGDQKPLRISLPTYPFAKERYWIPEYKEPIETKPLFVQSNIQFNDAFYDQILDEIMNDTISVDVAVQKTKKHR